MGRQRSQQSGELVLRLMGRPSLTWAGTELKPPSKRTLPLLAYLALSETPSQRRSLVRLLWSEGKAVNLRQEIAKLRKLPGSERFLVDIGADRLLSLQCESDVKRVQQLFELEDFRAITAIWLEQRCASLLAGLDLSFLPPTFHEWCELEEQQLESLFRDALHARSIELEAVGDIRQAVELNRELVRLDPLNETAHQAIIRLETVRGRPTAALRQFEAVRTILNTELRLPPQQETIDLAAAIPGSYRQTPARGTPARPTFTTTFIGRERQLAVLEDLLGRPDCRMISLLGLGGIGKTRLALELADRSSKMFGDGVLYLCLAHVDGPEMLVPSLLASLPVPPINGSPEERLLAYLEDKSYLIVLDNCEQLVRAAGLVASMLARSRQSKVLATSRLPLGLTGERRFLLKGLVYLPQIGEELQDTEAVRLFEDRVGRKLTAEELPAAAQVCRLVGGMPLAIEMASEVANFLPVAEIVSVLERGHFELLATQRRDIPTRHQSLASVLAGTWGLLNQTDQLHLAKLSVLVGEFGSDEASYAADVDILGLLRLAEASLLVHDSAGSFCLLEPIRWFALRKLRDVADYQQLGERIHLRAARYLRDELVKPNQHARDELKVLAETVQHLVAAEAFEEVGRVLLGSGVRLVLQKGQTSVGLELPEWDGPGASDPQVSTPPAAPGL